MKSNNEACEVCGSQDRYPSNAVRLDEIRSLADKLQMLRTKQDALRQCRDSIRRNRVHISVEDAKDDRPISNEIVNLEYSHGCRKEDELEELQLYATTLSDRAKSKAQDLTMMADEYDERQERIQKLERVVWDRSAQQSTISYCILSDSARLLESSLRASQRMRFTIALELFQMYNVDVGDSSRNFGSNHDQKRQGGIGKILGLPLPHAGLHLYSLLPESILTSALRLAALLVSDLSRVFKISLPHPILRNDDVPMTKPAASKSMKVSLSSAFINDSSNNIDERLKRASAAILLECPRNSSTQSSVNEFVLKLPEDSSNVQQRDDFAFGLQLLQHNIIHVCMSIGVSPCSMHASEALLLNLNECRHFCYEKVNTMTNSFDSCL